MNRFGKAVVWSAATVAMGVSATPAAAVVVDTFTRDDGPYVEDNGTLGFTEHPLAHYQYREKITSTSVGQLGYNTSQIEAGRLRLIGQDEVQFGSAGGGAYLLGTDFANPKVSLTMRFDAGSQTVTSGTTLQNSGIVFFRAKPDFVLGSNTPTNNGLVAVQFGPNGDLTIQETVNGSPVSRKGVNLWRNGNAVSRQVQAANVLPGTINGLPFDVNRNGLLEINEPFKFTTAIENNAVKVWINDLLIATSDPLALTGASSGINGIAVSKNRVNINNVIKTDFLVDDLELPLMIPGDADKDQDIDAADVAAVVNGFNNALTGWANGDFNGDGKVSSDDFALLSLYAPQFPAAAPASSAVPEPGMVGALAMGAIAAVRRRRGPQAGRLNGVSGG